MDVIPKILKLYQIYVIITPKGDYDMAKGPFIEFLRASIAQTAANAYIETQLATPASKTESMAMLIHSVEFEFTDLVDTAPANADIISAHLSKTSKATIRTIVDPDIIALYLAKTSLNAVFNAIMEIGTQKQYFDPPILYPKSEMFFGFGTTGFTSVEGAQVRIGYTIEKVSREDFIDALVE